MCQIPRLPTAGTDTQFCDMPHRASPHVAAKTRKCCLKRPLLRQPGHSPALSHREGIGPMSARTAAAKAASSRIRTRAAAS